MDTYLNMASIPAMAATKIEPRRSDRLVSRIIPEDKSLLMRAAMLEGLTRYPGLQIAQDYLSKLFAGK